ncbi:MAG: hypothetical protein J0H57_19190 [Rhodospirillales bacterium]|nr:hypothetical protein [Rhodospirillales bacterium]
MPVTVCADDLGRVTRRMNTEPPHLGEEFRRAQIPIGPHRFLDDGKQFAL